MSALADFHFIRPLALLAIVPVAWLWWWARRQADPLGGWREQIEPGLLRALTVGRRAPARGARELLAAMLAVLGVAGPSWRLEPSPFADDAAALVILLQVDAGDRDPAQYAAQLARARIEIADIAAQRAGQPLGLVAYAGSAHLVLPPTRDTAIVAQLAAEIDPSIMPRAGDRLGEALSLGASLFAGNAGSLVVICDRVDTTALPEAGSTALPDMQFLVPEPDEASVRAAAARLGAAIVPAVVDRADTRAILRGASRAALARRGDSARWEESGYWMVPMLAGLLMLGFRRERVDASGRRT